MNIQIRAARSTDADVLSALSIRSKHSNGYDAAFMAACQDELSVSAADINDGDFWVAEAGGALCGCACLSIDADDGKLGKVHTFFIDPGWQRRGVGRALWRKLVERAKAYRLESLHLDSDPHAVAFYERLGFRVAGEAASGSIPGRRLPRMEIAVAGCRA